MLNRCSIVNLFVAGALAVCVSARAASDPAIFSPGFLRMDVFARPNCDPGACLPGSVDPNYPDNPLARFYLTHADSRDAYPDDSHENYYARLWGYFVPDRTTNYTFYLRSDDSSQLWLSTDENPTNKVLLTEERGCCAGFSAHASAPQALVANQRYFFELIYFEGTGGDYGQASINAINVIPGGFLGVYADPMGASVTITRQPAAGLTVSPDGQVTLSIQAHGSTPEISDAPVIFQWQHRAEGDVFTNIPGATSSNYTFTAPSIVGCQFGTNYYRAVVSTPGASATSSVTRLLSSVDYLPPIVISGRGSRDLRRIIVTYSEPVRLADATNVANYTLANGPAILRAELDPKFLFNGVVRLTTESPLVPGSNYVLTVRDVHDLCGGPIYPNPTRMTFQAWVLSRGFALSEYYTNIGGNYLNDLTNSPAYPANPSFVEYVTQAEGRANWMDNYGQRMSGFFVPPVSGNYNFYLASDDAGAFYLSTNSEPAHLRLLCFEPNWSGYREWTPTAMPQRDPPPNQSQSWYPAGIPLLAGQLYYFEALQKEADSPDNLSIAVQLPGAPVPTNGAPPIPGEYLATLIDPKWRLDIRLSSGGVMLSWPAGGILQETTNLPAQWTDRSNAPNPFVISNGPTRFFRVRFTP